MRYEVAVRLSVDVSDGDGLREAALRAFVETHHAEAADALGVEAVQDVPGALSTLLGSARTYQALASVIDATGSSLIGVFVGRGDIAPEP